MTSGEQLSCLRGQTVLCGVVAPCYGADNKVPQLHATQSELSP